MSRYRVEDRKGAPLGEHDDLLEALPHARRAGVGARVVRIEDGAVLATTLCDAATALARMTGAGRRLAP